MIVGHTVLALFIIKYLSMVRGQGEGLHASASNMTSRYFKQPPKSNLLVKSQTYNIGSTKKIHQHRPIIDITAPQL